jgi:hypothetical protein
VHPCATVSLGLKGERKEEEEEKEEGTSSRTGKKSEKSVYSDFIGQM